MPSPAGWVLGWGCPGWDGWQQCTVPASQLLVPRRQAAHVQAFLVGAERFEHRLSTVQRQWSSRCSTADAHGQRVSFLEPGLGMGQRGARSPAGPLARLFQKQHSSFLLAPGMDLLFLTIRKNASALSTAGSKHCCKETFLSERIKTRFPPGNCPI